jgi:hypothetical protein
MNPPQKIEPDYPAQMRDKMVYACRMQYSTMKRRYEKHNRPVADLSFTGKIGRKFVTVIAQRSRQDRLTSRIVLYSEIDTGELFAATPSGTRPLLARGNYYSEGHRSLKAVANEVVARLM